MNECRIFETEQFRKDLRAIARSGRQRVDKRLRDFVYPQVRRCPHVGPNIRKLRGYSPDTWRYRVGAWRLFFEIDDERRIVFLIAAAHRSAAY